MHPIFEITGDDIAQLNDSDLRSLIALLCEDEFRLAGLSTGVVDWGGNQDAPDGGIDVLVNSEVLLPNNKFIPRKRVAYQVKVPKMPPAEIKKEMCPKGQLRPEIADLIQQGGAYIIASSKADTSERMRNSRISAMKTAVSNQPDNIQLHLDFFDRSRIASWVRNHPSRIIWVRNKTSRPLEGWFSYDDWTEWTKTGDQEYLIDDELKLIGTRISEPVSIREGIQTLCEALSQEGASIRLVGLSGLGKTRLAQALFDGRMGKFALNPTSVVYTDISTNPEPEPIGMARHLVARKDLAFLIVDNCPPELHRELTKVCEQSKTSLLTIEYDIREDQPEETKVYRLETSSDNLIEKILHQKFPSISRINSSRIAEFANGNARVAIALANTLEQDETISTLKDADLFNRLFYQRHGVNEQLRISAEICSLVYSFNGNDWASEDSELGFLAKLAEISPRAMYRNIAELRERELVQSRGDWRAILPQAIANQLAQDALKRSPVQLLESEFLNGPERLIISFTRRLGYLHDCDEAINLVNSWLEPDGWLGSKNCNFSQFELSVFRNIAPVNPEATLKIIERASIDHIHDHDFIAILRHLAFDPDFFVRAVSILCNLAIFEDTDVNNAGSARSTLKYLFHHFLSGTLAPATMRGEVINSQIGSLAENKQELGIELLHSTLKTRDFMSFYSDTFGARPRDFGYRPQTKNEFVNWYRFFLELSVEIALRTSPISRKARKMLAKRLRNLWWIGIEYEEDLLFEIESAILQIHEQAAWNDGWLAVQDIINDGGANMPPKHLLRLKSLSSKLQPSSLLNRVYTYVLSEERLIYGIKNPLENDSDADNQWKYLQETARQIGLEVANDLNSFKTLLPKLVSTRTSRLHTFGMGLAEGCDDKLIIWNSLYCELENTPTKKREIQVLQGFLAYCGKNEPKFYNDQLDSLLEDDLLGPNLPLLFLQSEIDPRGVTRLIETLDIGIVPLQIYKYMRWNNFPKETTNDLIIEFLLNLIEKRDGLLIALDILETLLRNPKAYVQEYIPITQMILMAYDFKGPDGQKFDYELARLVEFFLQTHDNQDAIQNLCQHIANEIKDSWINYPISTMQKIAKLKPDIFLDEFVEKNELFSPNFRFNAFNDKENPVNQISKSKLLSWGAENPDQRYALIVSSIAVYSKPEKSREITWSPIILEILKFAPNLDAILPLLETKIFPMSFGGSHANMLEERLVLFSQLDNYPNQAVQAWAKTQHHELLGRIEEEQRNEQLWYKNEFERFE